MFSISRRAIHKLFALGLLAPTLLLAGCGEEDESSSSAALGTKGARIYATVSAANEVVVFDDETHAQITSYPVGVGPAIILATPGTRKLYTANWGDNSVSAIDVQTELVRNIALPGRPYVIANDQVYTLNFLSDDVTVIDTASWKVETTIGTGRGTQGIIGNVTPDNTRLYVTNHGTSDLIGIDTASNQIVQTIPLQGRPVGVNFSPDGKRVYVTDFGPASKNEPLQLSYLLSGTYEPSGDGQLSVFDVATGAQVGANIPVGRGPTSIVVSDGPTP